MDLHDARPCLCLVAIPLVRCEERVILLLHLEIAIARFHSISAEQIQRQIWGFESVAVR